MAVCSDYPVLCHHVTTLGSFIHHRTGTNRRVSSSGLELSPLWLPGVWEGTLNYSSFGSSPEKCSDRREALA